MLKTNLILFGVMFFGCIFSGSIDLDSLTFEKGRLYKINRDTFIGELKKKNETISLPEDLSRQKKLQAEIVNARLKYPEIFKKLPVVIEEAKRNPRYGSEWSFNSRGIDILKNTLQNFMRQQPEQEKIVTSKNLTGNFGGEREKTVKFQTNEEIAKAKETNRAARLAVVEHMLKFAHEPRELRETVESFAHPIIYRDLEEDILFAIEDVLKGADNAEVMRSCISVLNINKFKNAAPVLRDKLDKALKENNYEQLQVLLNGLNSLGDENDQKRMKALSGEIEKMKKDTKMNPNDL